MYKRKSDSWVTEMPRPKKWPKVDEPTEWTKEDVKAALMINSLNIDASAHHGFKKKNNTEIYYKCSPFIQALDLANFDDWEMQSDFHEVWSPLPPIVQLWFTLKGIDVDA
jgi:hypothetical protein